MTDFFVSAAGRDANAGTQSSPWKTVTRANAELAKSGANTRVLFRRGDTFPGRLRPNASLDSTQPGWQQIGAYGTGDAPIITGYCTALAWTQHDADTWMLDYSANRYGTTYTGYDLAQGGGDVAFLKVNGAIQARKFAAVAELVQQWDFCSIGTVLYVRSSSTPRGAAKVEFCLNGHGALMRPGVEIADIGLVGHGSHGVSFPGGSRARLLRTEVGEVGGAFLSGRTRYGNGVQAWINSSDVYCEENYVHDVYDTAWSIQGGALNSPGFFTDITWRRNFTWRCAQAEEYWYQWTGPGFGNCLSEYNVNLFSGYGFGADIRPDKASRSCILTYNWGNPNDLVADLTLRHNTYFDPRGAYTYHAHKPAGLHSDHHAVMLRPGTKMQYQLSQTVENAADWATATGWDENSQITILPTSG